MSMLSTQVDNLRLTADYISEHGASSGDLAIIGIRLRGAADTIENLSDKLQGVMGTRYCELFGTPERAARTLSVTAKCFEPETACRECMYKGYCDTECDYDALLEWLEGETE